MGITIEDLNATVLASREHVIPAMKSGVTVKLSVGQILDLLIDGAPNTLDTLNKIAQALNNDENLAGTLAAALDARLRIDASQTLSAEQRSRTNASLGSDLLSGFRNVIINPLGRQNQRQKAGTVTLSAGAYGHDRFKAGAAGCTYTFSTNNGVTTFNIAAGSLQQVIEAAHFAGRAGDYRLSWQGTAQGRINGGAYGASGLVFANCDGSANVAVEWGTGTLSLPQFERGFVTEFSARDLCHEENLCRRYFERFARSESGDVLHLGAGHIQNATTFCVNFPMVRKRVAPSFSSQITGMTLAIGGADAAITALSVQTVDRAQAFLIGTSSGLTTGQSCSLSFLDSNYIDFSAEL